MFAQSQEKFIRNNLEKSNACLILNPEYKSYISTINPKIIKKILTEKFMIGAEMKAILCLFNTMLLTNTPYATSGAIYFPDIKIQNWIHNLQKLPVDSAEGYIYITDVFSNDIQVVIKVPRDEAQSDAEDYKNRVDSLEKEYFIGLRAINNLRYIIPTFSYTLGAFMCNKPTWYGHLDTTTICTEHTTPFVLYEKIPGKSVNTILQGNEIGFNQWLVMFAQVLLSLEIAQRKCKFTHFDLHSGNVMARPVSGMEYSLSIDESTYIMSDISILPVIIDFGMSTVEVDDVTVGSHDFSCYGMMHYMVQGYDMFKFLCYCTKDSRYTKSLDKMLDLFRFYGSDDPYNIYTKRYPALVKTINKYCSIGTYSKMATYTPLQFFLWIYKEYNDILSPHITIDPRTMYRNVQYSSSIQIYSDLFQQDVQGRTNAIQLASRCISSIPSYIMTKYTIKILNNYNKCLKSPIIGDKIKELLTSISSPDGYIAMDNARLSKVFNIKLPDMDELRNDMGAILDIPVGDKGHHTLIDRFITNSKFISDLQPYMQMYYTILELDLTSNYKDWIEKFQTEYYYSNNISMVSKTMRWIYTLQHD